MRYWERNRFDDQIRFEDNEGKIWESDDLDKLTTWEIERLELHEVDA